MSQSLVERYGERIAGILSCYDRVVITGTLPGVCYADGMTRFLYTRGIRIFDYPQFAMTLRDLVRDRAASLAEAEGIAIEHIAKAHIRKEDVGARVLAQRGDHPGLVHIISAMEACEAYKPWHDKQTHRTLIRPDSGKCLHYVLLLPGPPVRLDIPESTDLGTVPPAVLLQRSQLAGTQAPHRGDRLHHGRQCLRPHRRLVTRPGTRRCLRA